MSGYVQEQIAQVIQETEEILSETSAIGNREQAMISAYKEIVQLYRLDKEIMTDERHTDH